jgi:hypothetical protein
VRCALLTWLDDDAQDIDNAYVAGELLGGVTNREAMMEESKEGGRDGWRRPRDEYCAFVYTRRFICADRSAAKKRPSADRLRNVRSRTLITRAVPDRARN